MISATFTPRPGARPMRPSAYASAIASAEAARDDALAATAETNAARLALRRQGCGECDGAAGAGGRHARAICRLLTAAEWRWFRRDRLCSSRQGRSRRCPGDRPTAPSAAADDRPKRCTIASSTSLGAGRPGHLYERDRPARRSLEPDRPSARSRPSRHRRPNCRSAGTGSGPASPATRPDRQRRSPAIAAPSPSCNRCARTSRSNIATAGPRIAPPSARSISNSATCCCAGRRRDPARAAGTASGRRGTRSSSSRRASFRIISAIPASPALKPSSGRSKPSPRDSGALSDCAARPAGAAGQLRRRAAAIHHRRHRKQACGRRSSASANCWRSARPTNTWFPRGSSMTRSSARSSRCSLRIAYRYAGRSSPMKCCASSRLPRFTTAGTFCVDRYATAIAPSLKLVEPKPLAARSPARPWSSAISQSVQGLRPRCRTSPREVAAGAADRGRRRSAQRRVHPSAIRRPS